jgi:hypothetical protein
MGRPRMTEELNELGLRVGHPLPGSGLQANRERGRVGRLMRQNAICVVTEPINSRRLRTVARQAIAKQSAERGRPNIQHRARSLAAGFRCEPAQPEMPSHGLQANHSRVTVR